MKKYYAILCTLLIAAGCAREPEIVPSSKPASEGPEFCGFNTSEENLNPALINVLVTEEFAAELEKATGEDGWVNIPQTRASHSGAVRMHRLFPYAGKFEPRTRAEGMHLWYEVEYEPNFAATKAAFDFSFTPGIVLIESKPKIEIVGGSKPCEYVDDVPSITRSSAATKVFNDPLLGRQWHYFNDGSALSSVSGCDINVVPVWKTGLTGSSDVIVSVVDGGVDFTHEDLADNMWINPAKGLKANECYGYNFYKGNYQVTADDHGTHVAGTIAAVNNNGKGVCGIAGGDAAKKVKGVKIMSCQIFEGENGADGSSAIKWGADHGAVISQNSWGMTAPMSMPSSMKAAVDYFVKYAGLDENGVQTGPIAGGLVIFAAGNQGVSQVYGTVGGGAINVGSVGADFRKAYYSNYGSWVDIAAPGGDVKKGNQVLSTVPGNRYAQFQGTSMACPHVSGVAALLVSKMKGKGVTNKDVRKRLLENVTDISSFNKLFPLGSGLVNAYAAIAGAGGIAPDTPKNLTASAFSDNVSFSVTVPADKDDITPNSIIIYYSTSDFTSIKDIPFASFYTEDLGVGETLSGTIPGLDFNTKYYLCAVAQDLAGNKSGMSSKVTVTTGSNVPVVIKALDGTSVTIKAFETAKLRFEIENPADHYFQYSLNRADSVSVNLDTLDYSNPVFVLDGKTTAKEKEGIAQTVILTVTDIYGDSDTKEIVYTVLKNNPPVVAKEFSDIVFNSRNDDPIKFKASDFFNDPDGEDLTYSINVDGESANFVYSKGTFILTPMEYGYTTITVSGADIRGEKVSQTFKVLTRNSKSEVDAYPNPVSDYLYIRTSSESKLSVKVYGAIGNLYFEGNDIPVSAFEPAKIDMKDAAPGMYNVQISINGKEFKYNIVKL